MLCCFEHKFAKSENESLNLHGPYGAPYDKGTRYPQIGKMGVALQWGGGGGDWQITHSSYSTHQISSDTQNYLFPSNCSLPRSGYFFHISRPVKLCLKNRYFEEQIQLVPPVKGTFKDTAAALILKRGTIFIYLLRAFFKFLKNRAQASLS